MEGRGHEDLGRRESRKSRKRREVKVQRSRGNYGQGGLSDRNINAKK